MLNRDMKFTNNVNKIRYALRKNRAKLKVLAEKKKWDFKKMDEKLKENKWAFYIGNAKGVNKEGRIVDLVKKLHEHDNEIDVPKYEKSQKTGKYYHPKRYDTSKDYIIEYRKGK